MIKQKVILAPDESKDSKFLSKYINEAVTVRFLPDRRFDSPDEQRLYDTLKSIILSTKFNN